MFVPFIVVIPGMIAAVLVAAVVEFKAVRRRRCHLQRLDPATDAQLLPNGLLGVAIAGLLAAFMAGMAANISAFNTVFSYDLWQDYVVKDRPDDYYLRVGPHRDRDRHGHRDRHRAHRRRLQQPDGLPADAVRLLQRPAVRDLHPGHVLEADDPRRPGGRAWSSGTLAAVAVRSCPRTPSARRRSA